MPKPMGRGPSAGGKAKDFKKSIGKLLGYCKKYLPLIAAALVLAVTGTIFSLIGPNKLKDITNIIQEGFMSPRA